jgi:hypothetical protein
MTAWTVYDVYSLYKEVTVAVNNQCCDDAKDKKKDAPPAVRDLGNHSPFGGSAGGDK